MRSNQRTRTIFIKYTRQQPNTPDARVVRAYVITTLSKTLGGTCERKGSLRRSRLKIGSRVLLLLFSQTNLDPEKRSVSAKKKKK